MQSLRNRKSISEMLAVIIMLALTIVAGAFVYEVFFNKANSYSNMPPSTSTTHRYPTGSL